MIRGGGVGEENVGREGERKEDVVLHFSSHVSAEEGTGLGDHISRPSDGGLPYGGLRTLGCRGRTEGDELEARKICKI